MSVKPGWLELKCKFCGKLFSQHKSRAARSPFPFCSTEHRELFSDAEILRLRESGEPLIEVWQDSVLCRICGHSYQCIGSHLSMVHGVKTRGLSHLERNIVLGLAQGERAVSGRILEGMRQMPLSAAMRANRGNGNFGNLNWARIGKLRASIPAPAEAIERCIRNSHALHEAACTVRRCANCDEEFKIQRHNPNKRCPTCRRYPLPRGTFSDATLENIARAMRLRAEGNTRREIASAMGRKPRYVKRLLSLGSAGVGTTRTDARQEIDATD